MGNEMHLNKNLHVNKKE